VLLLEYIPAWPGVAPVYSPAADMGAKLSPGGKVRQLDVATQQFKRLATLSNDGGWRVNFLRRRSAFWRAG